MNENYFAKPGFQVLAQARHKFPLEMSGYKIKRKIIMLRPDKRIKDFFKTRTDTSWMLWNLIVFQYWYDRYFK